MVRRRRRVARRAGRRGFPWSYAAGLVWAWAYSLLAVREHQVLDYHVIASAPPGWGFLVDSPWGLAMAALGGWLLALWCDGRQVSTAGSPAGKPAAAWWLALAALVPLLDLARLVGIAVPVTCLEPLWLTFISGQAVWLAAGERSHWGTRWREAQQAVWLPLTWLVAVALGVYWYLQAQSAYDNYLLGYHDFGHFARRVVNTWEGRGWLRETPSLPPFWDHFNPGLTLLAPLWGWWPDARLFLLLQAVCLASGGPLVHGIARRLGSSPAVATVWAIAYLALPGLGQLNLNCTYGWHPVSQALPCLLGAIYLVLGRSPWRWPAAMMAAALACSFKESEFVTLGCLCFALALARLVGPRETDPKETDPRETGGDAEPDCRGLAASLPPLAWLLGWGLFTVGFMLVYQFTAFAEFQKHRFHSLGENGWQIALSPLLRPRAFWGQVLRLDSLWFLLALLLPLGGRFWWRGRWLLLAAAPPLLLLMAWELPHTTSIAFQYTTGILPVLIVAAITGSRVFGFPAAASALAAAVVCSSFLGALPFSRPTLTVVLAHSYNLPERFQPGGVELPNQPGGVSNPRARGTAGNAALNKLVATLNRGDLSVLASGRVAAHLLNVRRLEAVEQARVRWPALGVEAGPGESGIRVFQYVILDLADQFQQSREHLEFFQREAEAAGYLPSFAPLRQLGIVVLRRPDATDLSSLP